MSMEGEDVYRHPEGYPSDSDDPRSRPNDRYEDRHDLVGDRYRGADHSADAPSESTRHRPGADGDYGYRYEDRKHYSTEFRDRDRATTDRREEESFSRGDGRGRSGKSYRGGFESDQKSGNRRFRDDRNYGREDGKYESSGLNDYDDSSSGRNYGRESYQSENYGRESYETENYGRGGRSDGGHQSRKGGYKNEHDDRTNDVWEGYGERRSDDRDKYGSEDYGDDYDGETKYESHDDGLGGGYPQKNYSDYDGSNGQKDYGSSNDNWKSGGFGGRAGRGGGRGRMIRGSNTNEDEGQRYGGFGGNRDARGCFKCGGPHMARDCTETANEGFGFSSENRDTRGCFKCGGPHMARDCTEASNEGVGFSGENRDTRGCFKCGGPHMARDCTEASNEGVGFSGENRDTRGCFKCGGPHMARDCTEASNEGVGFSGENRDTRGCFKCGGPHMARDCTEAPEEGVGFSKENRRKPVTYIPEDLDEDEERMFSSVGKGINFDKYQNIPVEVTGTDPPKPINSFEECDIEEQLKKNVRKAKYDNPTPIQKWAIPVVLKGRDLMGCAQTGSGKTAGFLLPVLTGILRDGPRESSSGASPVALVVGPTRELVMQIYEESRKFSVGTRVKSVVIYGGVSVAHQIGKVGQGADIVIATVGRLLDFVRRGIISLGRVRYLILDEADRMLDMGFKDDILSLCFDFDMPRNEDRQTLLFSATFPEDIQQIAATVLDDYVFIAVGRVGGANKDIDQRLELVPLNTKKERLIEILQSQPEETKTIVFVEKKVMSDFLAIVLCQHGLKSTSIHGDREQREREEALKTLKSGKTPIIVATSVAARGLDIPGVGHVINYDLPKSVDEYVHRIGRTGRCGNVGKATSFYDPAGDSPLAQGLQNVLVEAQQEVPSWLQDFCRSSSTYAQAEQTSDFRYQGGRFGSGRTRESGGTEDRYGCGRGGDDWK